MKILGIDTSTKFLSLGILDNDKIYEYNIELARRHSSLLAVTIKRVLDALGWRVSDIDYFACGLGPGSFTGTRIALAAIKGLSFAVKKPIIGISTLDILAENAKAAGNQKYSYIIPVIDAKRNLVYCSIYKNKAGGLKRVNSYMLVNANELRRKIKSNSVILGDALGVYKEVFVKNNRGIKVLDKDYWYPRGRYIVMLAKEKLKMNKVNDAFNIKPIYLYPKECQVRK